MPTSLDQGEENRTIINIPLLGVPVTIIIFRCSDLKPERGFEKSFVPVELASSPPECNDDLTKLYLI